jgi:biofilm PGA synthesis N-glycosyltransferase PgaC
MAALFWISVAFIAYVYAGYPLLLGAWAWIVAGRVKPAATTIGDVRRADGRRGRFEPSETDDLPGVSIVIAARNEARRLPARIENLLASEYPADRLQIIVASDGSTDDTVDALAPYRDRIELLLLPPAGKASALNAAVAHARRRILVFADARQRFAPDAIRRMVSHFRDPRIGAVSGELLIDGSGSTIGDGVGAYWKYEKWLRRREAVVGSTLGVTGAIYAMRRWLWQPLPADTLLDDVLGPMRVVLRGYRVIFDPQAHAFDQAASDASAEMRRKVRTLAGNFQLLGQEPRLLVPLVNPVWLQFMSHKIGRLFVPYALAVAFVASAVLAAQSLFYATVCSAQFAFYGLALYGALLDRRGRPAAVKTSEVFGEAA